MTAASSWMITLLIKPGDARLREKGFTLVPLSLYEKKGRVKAELALVHGKQQWDKREDTKKRESQREMDRAMSVRRR